MSGRVQGVGFRWFAREAASRVSVSGDVCNLPDGRVEVRACGASQRLELLLADLRQGPPGARVDDVETLDLDVDRLPDGFRIRS